MVYCKGIEPHIWPNQLKFKEQFMGKKIKITVMKTARYDDLIEKYENPIEHACDMREGDTFISDGWARPEGLCESAWESMSPFVLALSCGGEDIYDGWMK